MKSALIVLSLAGVVLGQRIEALISGFGERAALDSAGNWVVAQSVSRPGSNGRNIRVQRSADDSVTFNITIGGAGNDDLSALRVAPNGDILLLGTTDSPDFPAHQSALWNRTTAPQDPASFLVRLDPAGNVRTSTYIAADGFSIRARSIAFGPDESLFVGAELRGPGVLKFGDRVVPGNGTLLVLKVDQMATRVLGGIRLGGSSSCDATVAAVQADASGSIFVAGATCADDFPTTSSAYLVRRPGGACVGTGSVPTLSPCASGVLARLDASDLRVTAATYLGGTVAAFIRGLAVDRDGSPYVTGTAEVFPANTTGAFPTTLGAFQEAVAVRSSVFRPESVFVAKLTHDLSTLVYSTFLNGSRSENPSSILVDNAGRAVVAGGTLSRDFPVTGAFRTPCGPDAGLNSPESGFVSRLDSEGRQLTSSVRLQQGHARINFLDLDRYPVVSAGDSLIEIDLDSGDKPSVACVVNGANFRTEKFIAPGQIVTFFGANFAPGTMVVFERLPVPAKLLYASTTQINAVVPRELAGHSEVTALLYSPSGRLSDRRAFLLRPANPTVKVFVTGDGKLVDRGSPLADVRLADGTLNSLENPARRGEAVSIFTTGVDLSQSTAVLLGGDPADLLEAIVLPGTFESVQMLKLRVPSGGAGGLRGITVTNGGQSTDANAGFAWIE